MKIFLLISFLSLSLFSNAQWEVGPGIGAALPITGYKEVVKPGWLLNGEGKYRFKNGNFAVGAKAQFVRLQKDNNPNDAFQNARMTVAPFLFTAEYEFGKGKLQPYITGGLGIIMYNLNYDVSPTEGKTVFNVSFSMMPAAGINYAATKNVFPFIEVAVVLVADGPPQGFPKGEKMTGYTAITAGVHYRFN